MRTAGLCPVSVGTLLDAELLVCRYMIFQFRQILSDDLPVRSDRFAFLQHKSSFIRVRRQCQPAPSASSFQIDSENEALLAALTKTLDDIPEDDVALAAFSALDEGDTPSCPSASPVPLSAPPSPAPERSLAPASEEDELSLVRTCFY